MVSQWEEAVQAGDAQLLSSLIVASSSSPQQAVDLLQRCLDTLKPATGGQTTDKLLPAPAAPAPVAAPAAAPAAPVPAAEVLATLPAVQCIQPRGRFDLALSKDSFTLQGKAGTLTVAWSQVQHVICLAKPDIGSATVTAATPHVVVLVLHEPQPYLKSTLTTVCFQADGKGEQTVQWGQEAAKGKPYEVLCQVLCAAAKKKQPVRESKMVFAPPSGKRSALVCYTFEHLHAQ
jgi:hypothetical protein